MITVMNVADLRKIVAKNRDEHLKLYEQAVDAYYKLAHKWLEDELARLLKMAKVAPGKRPIEGHYFNALRPEEHSDDFDRVISMLDRTLAETIELSESDFRNYVDNEWDWTRSFGSNTVAYTTSASGGRKRA